MTFTHCTRKFTRSARTYTVSCWAIRLSVKQPILRTYPKWHNLFANSPRLSESHKAWISPVIIFLHTFANNRIFHNFQNISYRYHLRHVYWITRIRSLYSHRCPAATTCSVSSLTRRHTPGRSQLQQSAHQPPAIIKLASLLIALLQLLVPPLPPPGPGRALTAAGPERPVAVSCFIITVTDRQSAELLSLQLAVTWPISWVLWRNARVLELVFRRGTGWQLSYFNRRLPTSDSCYLRLLWCQ